MLPTRLSTAASAYVPAALRVRLTARAQPRDDQVTDLAGGESRLLQRVGYRRLGERPVHLLAEPFFPHSGGSRAWRPPPVQELGGRRALADDLG